MGELYLLRTEIYCSVVVAINSMNEYKMLDDQFVEQLTTDH